MSRTLDLFQPEIGSISEDAVEQHAEMAYLRYAMAVIKDRALPAVTDGQKPSQRRILYAMYLLKEAKAVKCARIVGEVIGKYHPHGDTAAYDTLVRMAQKFVSRYPLIDGQGNFGSRDGAPAAAYRYTEARLTSFADIALSELKAGTVPFVPNYDGALDEPAVLPARLPLLLLNGASGIAVGMATEIPSHNLTEVAQALALLLTRPASTLDDVLRLLPGPDFPGGGQIVSSPEEIRAVYASGKGSLRVRARWTVEQLAKKDWQLVIHELPPGVSAQTVLTELDSLTNPKLKAAQKKLSQKQIDDKQTALSLLDRARDEAGRDAEVRLVIEPRSNKQTPEELAAFLLAKTSLETTVPLNMVVLEPDGTPKQKTLLELCNAWLEFRLGTVTRRTGFRINQIDARSEILRGRLICLLRLDEVLAIIREAADPETSLMSKFGLTQVQARDILEIRLRQLSRMEHIAVTKELSDLQAERDGLAALLVDPAAMRKQVAAEIKADAKLHGDARRTLIEESRLQACTASLSPRQGQAAGPALYTVRLSEGGWLQLAKAPDGGAAAAAAFKAGDCLRRELQVQGDQPVYLLTTQGRVYTLLIPELLQAGALKNAIPLASLRNLAGVPAELLAGPADAFVLLAQSAGYGFICRLAELNTRQRAGKAFVSLVEGSQLLPPTVFEPKDQAYVAAWSAKKCLLFPLTEMKHLTGGGKGVQIMALGTGQTLLGTGLTVDASSLPEACPAADVKPAMLGHRANAGAVYRPDRNGR